MNMWNTFRINMVRGKAYQNNEVSKGDCILSSETEETEVEKSAEAANPYEIAMAIEKLFVIEKIGKILLLGIVLALFRHKAIVFPVIGIILLIYAYSLGRVNVVCDFDEHSFREHDKRIKAWQRLAASKRKWHVTSESPNTDLKRNAGAISSISRVDCSIVSGTPSFIKSNADTVYIEFSKRDSLVFLPDAAYLIQGGKVTPLEYSEINIDTYSKSFVEEDPIPSDAKVVSYTWKYVNVDGTPDRRFKANRRIPVCLYGRVVLTAPGNIRIELQISNYLSTLNFGELIR